MVSVKDITVKIDPRNIDRTPIHRAMANRYLQIVQNAIGEDGFGRPAPWAPLSPRYARRVNPPVPTLYRSGRMYRGIRILEVNSDHATVVSSGTPYSAVHQWGNPAKNLPARQFFPIQPNGEPTQRAVQEMTRVAIKAAKFK